MPARPGAGRDGVTAARGPDDRGRPVAGLTLDVIGAARAAGHVERIRVAATASRRRNEGEGEVCGPGWVDSVTAEATESTHLRDDVVRPIQRACAPGTARVSVAWRSEPTRPPTVTTALGSGACRGSVAAVSVTLLLLVHGSVIGVGWGDRRRAGRSASGGGRVERWRTPEVGRLGGVRNTLGLGAQRGKPPCAGRARNLGSRSAFAQVTRRPCTLGGPSRRARWLVTPTGTALGSDCAPPARRDPWRCLHHHVWPLSVPWSMAHLRSSDE